MDRQLLRQNVGQKISVFKTNTCDDNTKIVHVGILFTFCLEDNKNTSVCFDY